MSISELPTSVAKLRKNIKTMQKTRKNVYAMKIIGIKRETGGPPGSVATPSCAAVLKKNGNIAIFFQ